MRLHAEIHGHGPPLVLWHGWGMNLRAFDGWSQRLAPHFEVHGVDLPGHGKSAWQPATRFDVHLPALLATLPRDCLLVGWSLGGLLALQAAHAAPERIRGLIILHGTPKFVSGGGWTHGVTADVLERFAHHLRQSPEKTVSDFLDLQVRGSRESASTLAQLRDSLQRHGFADAHALESGLELLRTADLRALAATLRVPTLVCAGQYDRVTPPAAGRALAGMIPGARFVELPRAGHAGFLSHSQDLADACIDWATSLAPAGHALEPTA